MGLLTLLPILLSLIAAFIVYAFKFDKTKQKNMEFRKELQFFIVIYFLATAL